MPYQAIHFVVRLTTLEMSLASHAPGSAKHSKDVEDRMACIDVRVRNMIKQVQKQVIATEHHCMGNLWCQGSGLSKLDAVKLSGFKGRT